MKKKDWMIQQFFRMWPRALFHSKNGKAYLEKHLNGFGVYVLYRDDHPYYIGKTINKTLIERLSQHALKPNALMAESNASVIRAVSRIICGAFIIQDDDSEDTHAMAGFQCYPCGNQTAPLPKFW
jgi:hypothetical protein